MKESSMSKITIELILRMIIFTIGLSILLDVVMSLLLTAVASKNASSVYNVEGEIMYHRVRFILLTIFESLICFLTCKYTTSTIIKKYNIIPIQKALFNISLLVIILLGIFMTSIQVIRLNAAMTELEGISKGLQNVTTYFADENEISDQTKIDTFIEYIKGIAIVSILVHIGTYIAIIGFERKWLEEA